MSTPRSDPDGRGCREWKAGRRRTLSSAVGAAGRATSSGPSGFALAAARPPSGAPALETGASRSLGEREEASRASGDCLPTKIPTKENDDRG